MHSEQRTVRSEVEGRVVDRRAVRLPFLDPNDEVDAGGGGGGPELLGHRSGHDDRLVDQQREPVLVTVPDRPRVDPDGRSRDEDLGEHDDPAALLGSLAQEVDGLRPRTPPGP